LFFPTTVDGWNTKDRIKVMGALLRLCSKCHQTSNTYLVDLEFVVMLFLLSSILKPLLILFAASKYSNNTNNNNSNIINMSDSESITKKEAVLKVHGPDRQGIVAAFSQVLYGHGCGIIDAEQSTDKSANLFFQRIHFDYSQMHTDRISLEKGFREVCERFEMVSELDWRERRKRVAILVSKYDHALWEILLRHRADELDCDIVSIISNHPDLEPVAKTFDIPFEVYKINKDTRAVEEPKLVEALQNKHKADLVILARYMQIVSPEFCNAFKHRVINIHHSFLPAFVGAKPYHRAFERGVKIIGATAHYATPDLDEGPIIAQDITRISHRDGVQDLIQKGRLLEKNTLVHAVKAHLEDRIIVYNNKCVVFGDV
jgi:formyltetrahydrofolate deformylase